MVANHFQPQRFLIGPALFPIYWTIVKVVAFFYMAPAFLVTIVIRHTQFADESWLQTLVKAEDQVGTYGLVTVCVVTAVFGAVQASGIAERNRISRAWSATNIVANLIFLLWWIPCFSSPEILRGPGISLTLQPAWMHFFWAFLATAVWNIGLGIANLLHPQWSRLRAICYLASNLASGLLFCWMTRTHLIASVSFASLGPARSAVFTHVLQSTLTKCFPFVLILTAIVLIVDTLRVLRAGEPQMPHTGARFKGPVSV